MPVRRSDPNALYCLTSTKQVRARIQDEPFLNRLLHRVAVKRPVTNDAVGRRRRRTASVGSSLCLTSYRVADRFGGSNQVGDDSIVELYPTFVLCLVSQTVAFRQNPPYRHRNTERMREVFGKRRSGSQSDTRGGGARRAPEREQRCTRDRIGSLRRATRSPRPAAVLSGADQSVDFRIVGRHALELPCANEILQLTGGHRRSLTQRSWAPRLAGQQRIRLVLASYATRRW